MIIFQTSFGTYGIIGGTVFFLAFAVIAYIIFRLLRRTVKMAFRLAIVVVIMAIALVGSISFFWLGTGSSSTKPKPKPPASRTR